MSSIKLKHLISIHVIILFYSVGTIFSKFAALQDFLSAKFFFFYGSVIAFLILYAVLWQQIIKVMPISTAFANKSVVVIWGMIWGSIIFHEHITGKMIVGACIILIGIYLVVSENE